MGLFRWAIAVVLAAGVLPAQPLRVRLPRVAEPPVPSDPLELVTGDAQPVTDITQRAQIINLLAAAHRNSNVRAQPYDLKTSFTRSGSLSAGEWQEEDISPGKGMYRWTVEGPGYSAANLTVDRILYSNQPSDGLPLRLIQAREAIFRPEAVVGPMATLRSANASLNGVDVVCALIAHNAIAPAGTGGRQWEEQEYCIDSKAGTLLTFSPAPGLYIHYDYSKALQFHDRLIWNGFTITQAGQTVVEARTESVTDPGKDTSLFQPAGLNQIGVGPPMSLAAWQFRARLPLPNGSAAAPGQAAQVVALHATESPKAEISDVELLASSDSSLNDAALDFVAKRQGRMIGLDPQAGATPQSHELVMILEFVNPQPAAVQQ